MIRHGFEIGLLKLFFPKLPHPFVLSAIEQLIDKWQIAITFGLWLFEFIGFGFRLWLGLLRTIVYSPSKVIVDSELVNSYSSKTFEE